MKLARRICLALIVVLLANPVLAVVSTSPDCDGRCCCCEDTGRAPTPKISSNTAMRSACCGPTGSIPCQMSAGSLPDAPLALIQTTQLTLADTIHLLPGSSDEEVSPQSRHLSISSIDTGAIIPITPLYLQSCRLIC
jgi:hypothetical protein